MTTQFQLDRLVAEAAVRDLAARFSDAVNRNDREAFLALWSPDGVWEIGEPFPARAEGAAACLSMLDRLMQGWAFFIQLTHSGVIQFDGRKATARWEMRETARAEDNGRSYDNLAVYDDAAEEVDGVWRFTRRTYHYVWVNDTPMPGRAFHLPRNLGR